MRDTSVIIIGAGLAGLATGCYAQMNGYTCRIFEHHSQPGGVAAAWQRKDYLIDGGIHFVMGHKPGAALYDIYRQLGIVPAVSFVDMTTYGRFLDEGSGLSLDITADLDRLTHDLKTLFPADQTVADELTSAARAMSRLDLSTFGLSRPPELSGPLDQLRDLWAMRPLLRYVVGKYAQPLAAYARTIQDPRLAALVRNLFLPEVPVFFAAMLLGLLAGGQMAFIEGGCRDFVGAIERRFLALGGQITYNATVERILVEPSARAGRDSAVGVRLSDGTEQRAGAVVSAADGYSTIFEMLQGRYADDKIRRRYATWPTFRPLFMASFGVARTFATDPPFVTIMLEQPVTVGARAVDTLLVRIFNYSTRFAPAGKTVVQVECETDWDSWYNLRQQDRARYDAEKERVAGELLRCLERRYAGIASQVEVTDVATPYTTWRYTRNRKGAWEGWLMTPDVMTQSVERTLPGLDDFYMAGQWVMPGGGVPPCLYSGMHAVQLLCRRDGKPFRVAV